MIDEKMISQSGEILAQSEKFISSADKWGTISVTIFFVVVFLAIVLFVLYYALNTLNKALANNTEAISKLNAIIDKEFDSVKAKQNDMHIDIKEILHNVKERKNGKSVSKNRSFSRN